MTSMRSILAASLVLLATAAQAQVPEGDVQDTTPPATPAENVPLCPNPLPQLRTPIAFMPGELLEFDLDALGAQAGKMTMKVQRPENGSLPVEIEAKTNTFFSKVRRVNGLAVSYLHPRTLRPSRYTEDATENEVRRKVEVAFGAKDRSVKVDYVIGKKSGRYDYTYDKDGLDVAGAIYLLRQLPMKEGLTVCFDVVGIRRLWRMTGTVMKREHVSLPIGEFDAWYLTGTAVRTDKPTVKREVHVWISDDARRLPLVAVGTIDLGAVRATLTSYSRPGEKTQRAQGKEDLKW
ncbi:DUF3108 domain-containing protein [Hyalangium rubrum]|uniref:DUF3108 domain-containing protein n=1 Tax=Hyalangium rubrum TaxID=3103134 RepID=A0ABU5GXM5_9BACT|nr:DUF3108 domain-containing protein [Hyalangium sp. s54d21]MDY7225238.1 DUF3108 domain-containing protein [Hyalangium sp. s54d21]